MQKEIFLESDIAALQSLRRSDLVGAYIYKQQPKDRSDNYPLSGPFWYYWGEVERRHRDGTLTVCIHNCTGERSQTLRFDTTFHAERFGERYALVPWTKAIERRIKVQRLNHLCWSMGCSGWAHLGEQELEDALTLARAAFTRFLEDSEHFGRVFVGTLDAVLSVNERAVLSVGAWRYEVMITNKAEGSGILRIYSTEGSFYEQLNRSAVAERLFSSIDEVTVLLAEIGETFSAVSKDATWCSIQLEQSRQVQ